MKKLKSETKVPEFNRDSLAEVKKQAEETEEFKRQKSLKLAQSTVLPYDELLLSDQEMK